MKVLLLPVLAFLVSSALSLEGALLLNFAPSANAVTGTDAQASAAHSAGAVPLSEVSWNNITTGDVASGLVWSNGSNATGVSVNLGVSPEDSDVINFTNNPGSVGLGSTLNTGIYSGTRPARYGTWAGGTAGQNIALGIRIDGLAAGTYTLYFTGRNTNNSGALGSIFYAAAGGTVGTFDFSAVGNTASVTNSTSASYIQGDNYNTLTVTLTAGQSLYLATQGADGSTEERGFFNSLEIVPEPGTALLLGAGFLLVLRRRRAL
jgi:hypothetical protein